MSWRILFLTAALGCVVPVLRAHAQARPAGHGRGWLEVGLAGARQSHRCSGCVGSSAIGGAAASAAGGLTVGDHFGVAVLGRAFNEFSFESTLRSRYVVALGQYSPPRVPALTLNAGAGWGRHYDHDYPRGTDMSGTVLFAGTTLRLPPRSAIALSITADVIQSVAERSGVRPRLLSIGLALGAATDAQ